MIVSFSFNLLKNKGKRHTEYIQCHLDVTVCSRLQQSWEKKKTHDCSRCSEDQLNSVPVLEIKVCNQTSKLESSVREGTGTMVCIWASFLSQRINILLPASWRLFLHCFSLSSCWVETAGNHREGMLWSTGDRRQTLSVTSPSTAAMPNAGVPWKDTTSTVLLASCCHVPPRWHPSYSHFI